MSKAYSKKIWIYVTFIDANGQITFDWLLWHALPNET